METISKAKIINKIATKCHITKTAAKFVIDETLAAVADELIAGNNVYLSGFGTFEIRERIAHEGVNPSTKEKIRIAAKKGIGFKAAKAVKEAMNPKPIEKP